MYTCAPEVYIMFLVMISVPVFAGGGIGAGIRRSMRPRGKRSGINLKEEMKQLIYPLSGPVCVSKDERVFKDIMMVFYHYEEAVIKLYPYACTCRYHSLCCLRLVLVIVVLISFGEGIPMHPHMLYMYSNSS